MYNAEFIERIFGLEYFDRVEKLKNNNWKLAHYTSARVALSIIENKTIWLNNVQYMNDYSEIEIGHRLLTDFTIVILGKSLKELLKKYHLVAVKI